MSLTMSSSWVTPRAPLPLQLRDHVVGPDPFGGIADQVLAEPRREVFSTAGDVVREPHAMAAGTVVRCEPTIEHANRAVVAGKCSGEALAKLRCCSWRFQDRDLGDAEELRSDSSWIDEEIAIPVRADNDDGQLAY
jgi:hypothetical protein